MESLAHLFAWVCGQNAEHTWAPGEVLLPCCQRCTGLYVGAGVAALLHRWLRPRLSGRFLEMHGAFLVLMVPFGFHWLSQGPALRAAMGVLFGFGLVTFLWLVPGARAGSSDAARPAAAATLAYFAGVAFTAALVPALGTWGGGTAAVCLGGLIFAGLMVLGVLAVTNVGFGLTTAARWARRTLVLPHPGGPAPAVGQTPGQGK